MYTIRSVFAIFVTLCFCVLTMLVTGCQPREKKVTIMGNVVFDEYSKGDIYIGVFDNKISESMSERIGGVKIDHPGYYSFELTMPGNLKNIYIGSFNDEAGNGIPIDHDDPRGGYAENPIELSSSPSQTFDNIDIILKKMSE